MKEEAGRIAGQVPSTPETPSALPSKLSGTREASSGTTVKPDDALSSTKGLSELLSELSDVPASSSTTLPSNASESVASETMKSRDSSVDGGKLSEDVQSQVNSIHTSTDGKSPTETSETETTSPGTSSGASDSLKDDSDPASQDSTRTDQPYSLPAGASIVPTIIPQEAKNMPALSSSGESIFRTIMTRLTALETNSSLVLRYVEEQTRSLRDALRKVEEDVGRLEGLVSKIIH